jgi:hypothetical protein
LNENDEDVLELEDDERGSDDNDESEERSNEEADVDEIHDVGDDKEVSNISKSARCIPQTHISFILVYPSNSLYHHPRATRHSSLIWNKGDRGSAALYFSLFINNKFKHKFRHDSRLRDTGASLGRRSELGRSRLTRKDG